MKAMILAAGLGTRLRPLTNDRPKALVEVAGRTLLEITIARLRQFGVTEIIVNVHHFADKVIDYLRGKDNFGIRIEVSREDTLLDTGGGLKKAAWFFRENRSAEEPFLLHNVDVISDIDLKQVADFHRQQRALATVAVQHRETSRYLLFDQQMQLCGRRFVQEQKTEMARAAKQYDEFAFTGIHVISRQLLDLMEEEGAFSIVQTYLRLAGQEKKIIGYNADGASWRDLGKPKDLAQAENDLRNGFGR
jgi:NDP-sugar pyrophosphorylase family protein